MALKDPNEDAAAKERRKALDEKKMALLAALAAKARTYVESDFSEVIP